MDGVENVSEDMGFKDVATRVTSQRIWLGFPHYVVLGWAVLVSYTIFNLTTWRDHFEKSRETMLQANADTLSELSDSIQQLQRTTRELHDDSIRTRTILELKFPKTAQRVEDAINE